MQLRFNICVSIITTVLLVQCLSVSGFKQEVWLNLEDGVGGDHLYFAKNQPDLSAYRDLLPRVTSYCAKGVWWTYADINFESASKTMGSLKDEKLICRSFNASGLKSLRHYAVSDTSIDSISLYSGTSFNGPEILVDVPAYVGISTTIGSLAATGTPGSNWKLFEGQYLDGKSFCLQVPREPGYYFSWIARVRAELNLTTIGSVYKGCDPECA